ncbi:lactosylceramide 4-alpha-galactosyltransferase isoform X1 [Daphnia magna]|uniref:lactosylceramide 4-alpha-galactosyltransferase isoform X1 n=1 Tax=Daphnia magna TaxID=35525 RepID=UPI001E1BC996|nr:lactosylceramide 4-alpha-galactosyltransferase isoform X1 [Daphnia magna]
MFRVVNYRRFIFALAFLTTCAVILVFHSKGKKNLAELLLTSETVDPGERPPSKRREPMEIFFIESSGHSCLTARQACGIESAARANPQAKISVYVQNTPVNPSWPETYQDGQDLSNCPITRVLLQKMANVRVVQENLLPHLQDTPLWQLYTTGSFNKSTWRPFHLSDAVRVALLWKKGGLYLDLDCIVLRSLDSLNNTVGTVDYSIPNWVENGVMAFPSGHPFLHFLMKYMVLAFEPDRYMSLGPETLTEAIRYFCDRDDDLLIDQWMFCWHRSSIFIQQSRSFYAIPGARLNAFYQPEFDPADWDMLHRYSFLSHIYGSGHGQHVPPGSLYAQLAVKYCPTSFRLATETSSQF